MSPFIDVHCLGQVAFVDDVACVITTRASRESDGPRPWILAVVGATLVALGALAFGPDADNGPDRAPCAQTVCPPAPDDRPPTR